MKAYVLTFPGGGRFLVSTNETHVVFEATIEDTKMTITIEPDTAREVADAIVELSKQIKVAN